MIPASFIWPLRHRRHLLLRRVASLASASQPILFANAKKRGNAISGVSPSFVRMLANKRPRRTG
ncbi:hypothetical protein B4113_4011 [Geobacillus sp. B4113_201601]|nr:hypothetical protein B4113_4011 [Geobacillus sp. B4113_201601]